MVPSDAADAMNKLDGTIFQGRLLHVLPAKQQKEVSEKGKEAGPSQTSAFKRAKETKEKDARDDENRWNALFMRSDTVASAAAERFGVEKTDLLS